MNKEAHPNLHAVGLTTDILESISRRLRGGGTEKRGEILSDEDIKREIVGFVVAVSTRIDEIVGNQTRG